MSLLQLQMLNDMCRQEDARLMCAVVCAAEGAGGIGHLYEINKSAFDDLYAAVESLNEQIPVEEL